MPADAATEPANFPRGIEIVTGTLIRNKKGEILLIKSPKWEDKWLIPGGHVEPGEKILDSAFREAQEETGLPLTPITIVTFRELIAPKDFHRSAHLISFVCLLETDDATKMKVDPREVSDYRWVLPEDVLQLPLTGDLPNTMKAYIAFSRKHTKLLSHGS